MTTSETICLADFPVRHMIVDDDEDTLFSLPILNTTRPLLGEPIEIGKMGFSVIAPYDQRQLYENYRLDAHLMVFHRRSDAVRETRERLSVEYGDDAVAELDDETVLSMWNPEEE